VASANVTKAVVAAEAAAIAAWARRRDWSVAIATDYASLDARSSHPVTSTVIVFHADLDDYPVIPPAWTCLDAAGTISPAAFPVGGQRAGVPGSIFHPNQVFCAPWNRLAYGVHGGPHPDWSDLAAWKSVGSDMTQAHTIADMLNSIALHLSASPGTAA
jgi:hypothetical protein